MTIVLFELGIHDVKMILMAKLNQMITCIIPLSKFKAASDACCSLTANFCTETTLYVNTVISFWALALEGYFFYAGLETLYFKLHCISH